MAKITGTPTSGTRKDRGFYFADDHKSSLQIKSADDAAPYVINHKYSIQVMMFLLDPNTNAPDTQVIWSKAKNNGKEQLAEFELVNKDTL
jgi:hypothetical protein